MSIISLQEIMLVLAAAVVLIAYHTHLVKKVRRDPLTTAVGITNSNSNYGMSAILIFLNLN